MRQGAEHELLRAGAGHRGVQGQGNLRRPDDQRAETRAQRIQQDRLPGPIGDPRLEGDHHQHHVAPQAVPGQRGVGGPGPTLGGVDGELHLDDEGRANGRQDGEVGPPLQGPGVGEVGVKDAQFPEPAGGQLEDGRGEHLDQAQVGAEEVDEGFVQRGRHPGAPSGPESGLLRGGSGLSPRAALRQGESRRDRSRLLNRRKTLRKDLSAWAGIVEEGDHHIALGEREAGPGAEIAINHGEEGREESALGFLWAKLRAGAQHGFAVREVVGVGEPGARQQEAEGRHSRLLREDAGEQGIGAPNSLCAAGCVVNDPNKYEQPDRSAGIFGSNDCA